MKEKKGVGIEGREGVGLIHCCMMNITICTWNVKGLGWGEKRWGIKDLVKRWKVDLLILQEMEMRSIERRWTVDMWVRDLLSSSISQ